MTKRNNKKLAEIEESLKNDKVTLKTLKSLLIEEAHRNYNTRALGIRISVAQKFQEALANGATKAELGRWWGTKNFNTIQDLLALAEPIAETAQEATPTKTRTETPLPMEILPDGLLRVGDRLTFEIGGFEPIDGTMSDYLEVVKGSNRPIVRRFLDTGELP